MSVPAGKKGHKLSVEIYCFRASVISRDPKYVCSTLLRSLRENVRALMLTPKGGGGGKPWGLSAAPKGGGESPGD